MRVVWLIEQTESKQTVCTSLQASSLFKKKPTKQQMEATENDNDSIVTEKRSSNLN